MAIRPKMKKKRKRARRKSDFPFMIDRIIAKEAADSGSCRNQRLLALNLDAAWFHGGMVNGMIHSKLFMCMPEMIFERSGIFRMSPIVSKSCLELQALPGTSFWEGGRGKSPFEPQRSVSRQSYHPTVPQSLTGRSVFTKGSLEVKASSRRSASSASSFTSGMTEKVLMCRKLPSNSS